MTSAAHIRVSAGVPEGGRFAPSGRAESDLELESEPVAPAAGTQGATPTKKRKALRRGTIRIAHQVPGGLREYTETEAVLVGGFGVHRDSRGRGWGATHAASGMRVTPSWTATRRVDALRVSTALMAMTEKVPGYWDTEEPSGQHRIGQLPTSPERQARYGSADGMIFAHDTLGIARHLVFAKDAADPDYQSAQRKFEAITGRPWSPED